MTNYTVNSTKEHNGEMDQSTFSSTIWYILQQIKSLIFPEPITVYQCGNSNVTHRQGPSVWEFLDNIERSQLVLLIISCSLTLIIAFLSFFETIFVYRKISSEQRRNKLYFLITLFPITMSLCLVGMFFPRAAPLATSSGMMYFLLCLFVLVSLIRHLAGGRRQLSRELLVSGRDVNFQSPPFCCIFPCLPTARPTIRNLKFLEFIVLQAPIVRAFVLFIEATITIEIQRDATFEVQICEFATLVSILLAVFGVHTLYRLVSVHLDDYGFMWMFRIVDVALLFFSAQHPIIFQNILLRFNLIGCTKVMIPPENARFLCNFIIICELFFLAVLGFITMNPNRNRLFDLHKTNDVVGHVNDAVTESESLTDSIDPSQDGSTIICYNNE